RRWCCFSLLPCSLSPPRPPRSTLFPYRRSSDLAGGRQVCGVTRAVRPHIDDPGLPAAPAAPALPALPAAPPVAVLPPEPPVPPRSEEHTSELQSRENLVCRLLLEKKKQLSLKTP